MPRERIDIRFEDNGVVTNADPGDLSRESLVELKNFTSQHGRLVKTFGFGDKGLGQIDAVGSSKLTPVNIVTYINEYLSSGFVYIVVFVDSETNLMSVKYWNGSVWADIDNLLENTLAEVGVDNGFRAKDAKNFILQENGILRILPGNVGNFNPNYPDRIVKGLWIGYIERDFFDGRYKSTGFSPQWTAGFYAYPTEIIAPDVSDFTLETVEMTGATAPVLFDAEEGDCYYEFSYIYGGHDFNASLRYKIFFDSCWWEIDNFGSPLDGKGHDTFKLIGGMPDIDTDCWNAAWEFYEEDSPGSNSFHQIGNASTGLYAGNRTYITKGASLGSTDLLEKDYFVLNLEGTPVIDIIASNKNRAIKLTDTLFTSTVYDNKKWAYGFSYFTTDDGTDVTYRFIDRGLTDLENFVLENSPSINVNGEFGIVVKNILFQANPLLCPGEKQQENHPGWVTYSEFEQLDVNPVGNVLQFLDREGGRITGFAESFGSLFVFKEHAVFKLTLTDPTDPASWRKTESVFDHGCISRLSVVQFGQHIVYASDDGIYQLAPNMESAADDTPFIKNRISESINDVYEAVVDKTSIRGIYDDQNAELVFFFDCSADYALWAGDSNDQLESSDDVLLYAKGEAGRIWAYSILNGTWREIYSDVFGDIVALDENGKVMVYDDADSKLFGITDKESVLSAVKTKEYRIGGKYKRLLHSIYVEYKSAVNLALELYTDSGITASKTAALAASPKKTTKQVILRKWCKTVRIRIAEPSASASDVEIYAIYEDKR